MTGQSIAILMGRASTERRLSQPRTPAEARRKRSR